MAFAIIAERDLQLECRDRLSVLRTPKLRAEVFRGSGLKRVHRGKLSVGICYPKQQGVYLGPSPSEISPSQHFTANSTPFDSYLCYRSPAQPFQRTLLERWSENICLKLKSHLRFHWPRLLLRRHWNAVFEALHRNLSVIKLPAWQSRRRCYSLEIYLLTREFHKRRE